ncbi:hypothetical protein NHX12_002096 [Muraenolepis orangiensis]|uniref:Uncharacterized protein n=1 Tax=Muraenolepis orangiensis TaxID=630683 RepID=A0A9Q0E0Y7_9TELE|nr:hypothetical protein NHX12_002096 [Muraenolepis orangiensis]
MCPLVRSYHRRRSGRDRVGDQASVDLVKAQQESQRNEDVSTTHKTYLKMDDHIITHTHTQIHCTEVCWSSVLVGKDNEGRPNMKGLSAIPGSSGWVHWFPDRRTNMKRPVGRGSLVLLSLGQGLPPAHYLFPTPRLFRKRKRDGGLRINYDRISTPLLGKTPEYSV